MVRERAALIDGAGGLMVDAAGGGASCSRSRSRADDADARGFMKGMSDRPSHHDPARTAPVTPEIIRMRWRETGTVQPGWNRRIIAEIT